MNRAPVSSNWLLFLANLPGRPASTPRVRLWRAMKDLGAGTLRDGAAVLPATDAIHEQLKSIRTQLEADGGSGWLLELGEQSPEVESALRALFDRSDAYRAIAGEGATLRSELPGIDEVGARRRLRQLERDIDNVRRVDYFPGAAREEAVALLADLNALVDRRFSPSEPSAAEGTIERCDPRDYRGRTWATRRRPWVDRVASAWLIRRFVDPQARFAWLEHPGDCPREALGFDFDGAAFTHVGERVTFEVLLASFGLESEPGLADMARLVHYLDVGGEPVPEAAGFEAVLSGFRDELPDDDHLLDAMTPVLDALCRRYSAVDT